MSTIRPFSAIRYATAAGSRDISTKLAPPYDVLDEQDKQALLDPDPCNFVKVDLPFIPPKSAGPPEVYQTAHQQIEQWLADGTLVKDDQPAIYVYHQTYNYAGVDYTRKMFYARLRIEAFGTGDVFPHERTFGGPKEDRLALMKATKSQLSPIFGLYEDSQNTIAQKLEAAIPAEALAHGTLAGIENRIWPVTDPKTLRDASTLMLGKPVFIADGHHRYGTAGLYRDWLIEQAGPLPEDHPANFVLCVFCAMEDPGLLILPTHRVLAGITLDEVFLRDDEQLDVATLNVNSAEHVPSALSEFGPQALAVYNSAANSFLMVRPKQADILKDLEPDHTPAWHALGLAFLHAYLLDRMVTPQLCNGQAPAIQYVKAAQAAVDAANTGQGTAFILQATTMEELRGVCRAGEVMPQKSTYFYPKLASGLVVNPLS